MDEFDNVRSISTRTVNMTKKFLPHISDFQQFSGFLIELHRIHSLECKIVMSRVNQVTAEKDLADESHCNPSRFFKYRSIFGEFKRFWRDFNDVIYTREMKEQLSAAYHANAYISRIDIGYHINRTGKERNADLLALFNTNTTATRIHFADGTTLDIPSLDHADMVKAFEVYNDKRQPAMPGEIYQCILHSI